MKLELRRAQKEKADAEDEHKHLILKDIERLTLRAPVEGKIIGVPHEEEEGKKWDPKEPFCKIGDPGKLRVQVPITPGDFELLTEDIKRRGSHDPVEVTIRVQGHGARTWKGRVLHERLPREPETKIPAALAARGGGHLAAREGSDPNYLTPQSQVYLVDVVFLTPDAAIALERVRRSRSTASIAPPPGPCGAGCPARSTWAGVLESTVRRTVPRIALEGRIMPDKAADSGTSISLLVRLQHAPADQAAWAEFVHRYGMRIDGWCRRWGLQEADAQDVSQEVLLKLIRAMQRFRYDPAQRFRGWLMTVAHHAWQDLVRGRRQVAQGGDPAAGDPLQSLAARDDLAAGSRRHTSRNCWSGRWSGCARACSPRPGRPSA